MRPNPTARQVPDTSVVTRLWNNTSYTEYGEYDQDKDASRSVLRFHGLIYRPSMMDLWWGMS